MAPIPPVFAFDDPHKALAVIIKQKISGTRNLRDVGIM
jgi:hypothetical protein